MTAAAYSWLTIKTLSDDERVIEGTATTPEPDRVGDVVMPLGARFQTPLPLLLDHNSVQAVGEVQSAHATADGITFRAKIAKIAEPGAARDLVDNAWTLVRSGLRKAVSIGFRTIAAEPMPSGGLRFVSWDWLELSLVSVPANASATIATIKSLDAARLRAIRPAPVVKLSAADYRAAGLPVPRPVATATLAAMEKRAAQPATSVIELHTAGLVALAKATDAELAAIRAEMARGLGVNR